MRTLLVFGLLAAVLIGSGRLAAQTSTDLENAIDANFDIAFWGGGGMWHLDPLVTMANPTGDLRTALRAVHTAMMNAGGSGPVTNAWTLPGANDPVEVIWDVNAGTFTSSVDNVIVLLTGTSGGTIISPMIATVTGDNASVYVVGGDGTGTTNGAEVTARISSTSGDNGFAVAFGGWALGSGDGGEGLADNLMTSSSYPGFAQAFGGDAAQSGSGGIADAYNGYGEAEAWGGQSASGIGGNAAATSGLLTALAAGGDGLAGGGDATATGDLGATAAGGYGSDAHNTENGSTGGTAFASTRDGTAHAIGGSANTGGRADALSEDGSAHARGGDGRGPGSAPDNGGHAFAERLNTSGGQIATATGGDSVSTTGSGGDAEARRPGSIEGTPASGTSGGYAER